MGGPLPVLPTRIRSARRGSQCAPASQADSASSILVTRSIKNPYGIRDSVLFGYLDKILPVALVGRYEPLLTVL